MGENLADSVEIERIGFLNDSELDSYNIMGAIPFVQHVVNSRLTFRNRDIAIAAREAGYKTGDKFKYQIVIKCKSQVDFNNH